MTTGSPEKRTLTSYKTRTTAEWIPLIDEFLTRKPKSSLNAIAEDVWRRVNPHPPSPSDTAKHFKEFKKAVHRELKGGKQHFHLAPPEGNSLKSKRWMNLADYIKLFGEAAVDDTEEAASEEPPTSDDDQGGTSNREHSLTPLRPQVLGTSSNTGSPSISNSDKDAEIERLKAIIQGLRDTINQQGALNEQQGALYEQQGALYEQQGALYEQQGALIKQQKALINQQGALNVQPPSAQFSSMSLSGSGK
ncbi:hypothetical protein BV898_19949 [Hypsibius exemplaris]|uniref:Myb/SANT-like DNA-binding domain-containing protein n=1 Tax=Hypsibius exemplaris TaxID=2072580 RepID=A0A9X6RQ33_HYPEX|nr:hypothetical protein BV898_19949 [Hypsibius exemplaris]